MIERRLWFGRNISKTKLWSNKDHINKQIIHKKVFQVWILPLVSKFYSLFNTKNTNLIKISQNSITKKVSYFEVHPNDNINNNHDIDVI